jgi:hypothetical protein
MKKFFSLTTCVMAVLFAGCERNEPTNPTKKAIGIFSVSIDKQVTFSNGNLQYTQSTNTWSFADNQWDMIGGANIRIDADVLGDKIDLFGWSTSSCEFGISTSTDYKNYYDPFLDWGTNMISSETPNIWRTLTNEEWYYLLMVRNNASSLLGLAQVNGVNGIVLLSDNWVCPNDISFKSGIPSGEGIEYYALQQTFTADQWQKLEKSGAVFLPASGLRNNLNWYIPESGFYWSSSRNEDTKVNAYYFVFSPDTIAISGQGVPYYGMNVRLVRDL